MSSSIQAEPFRGLRHFPFEGVYVPAERTVRHEPSFAYLSGLAVDGEPLRYGHFLARSSAARTPDHGSRKAQNSLKSILFLTFDLDPESGARSLTPGKARAGIRWRAFG
jgi:hypothetical protein